MRAVAQVRATGCCAPISSGTARRPVWAVALLAVVAVACVSQAPISVIAPGHEGAPGVERLLLAPANLALALRPELEGGVEAVQEEIVAYLRLQGRQVERVSLLDGRRLWEESIAEVKASGVPLGFDVSAAAFARKLGESRDFQALVMPSLLLHQTRVKHRKASWDGVKRRMDVVNMPHARAGRSDDMMLRAMTGLGMTGDAAVSSLHVVVIARDGKRVFEGRGGLDLVQEIEVKSVDRSFRIDLRTREALLQDRAILREGVEIAFTPYLPVPRER